MPSWKAAHIIRSVIRPIFPQGAIEVCGTQSRQNRQATAQQNFTKIDAAMDQNAGQVSVNCACDPQYQSAYAYVNPIVAVILGWLVLAEPLTPRTLVAGAVIVFAVALIITARGRMRGPAEAVEPVLADTAGERRQVRRSAARADG